MSKGNAFFAVAILFFSFSQGPPLCPQTATVNPQATPAPFWTAQEELLGETSPDFKADDIDYTLFSIASPDGKRIAWAEGRAGNRPWLVQENGQPIGPLFEREDPPTPPGIFFSDDSRHLLVKGHAYLKGEFKVGEFTVLLDGTDQKKDYGVLLDALFSPDGQTLMIVSEKGVFLNGQRIFEPFDLGGFAGAGPWQESNPELFMTSRAPGHLGYIFTLKRAEQFIVLRDGDKKIIEDPAISSVSFASFGRFELVIHRNNKWSYLIDGEEGPAFDVLGRLLFSSDGKHYAYGGISGQVSAWTRRSKGTTMLITDGNKLEYQIKIRGNWPDPASSPISLMSCNQGISDPVFSSDGLHMAYSVADEVELAELNEKRIVAIRVIRDGRKDPLFFEMKPVEMAFSPDGTHLACLGFQGEKLVEVRDGTVTGAFESLGEYISPSALTWSADGQRTAFIAHVGNHIRVVTDGVPGKEYQIRDFWPTKPVFSPNGKHWACVIRDTKIRRGGVYGSFVLIDGQEGKAYDDVVRIGRLEGESYIKDSLFFPDDETVVYVAREGHKFYRVTCRFS